jgi:hypothetical protein
MDLPWQLVDKVLVELAVEEAVELIVLLLRMAA